MKLLTTPVNINDSNGNDDSDYTLGSTAFITDWRTKTLQS